MDIVAHTASSCKSKESLKEILDNDIYTKIELDFHLTKDGELIWTHDKFIGGKSIDNINYSNLKQFLTIEDIIDINNTDKMLMLEIKDFKYNFKHVKLLLKKLDNLKFKNIALHSFNQDLIKYLLTIKKELNVEIGLIINLFKTFNYRNGNIMGLEQLDFVSLSCELFEWPVVGNDYKRYRELFPNVMQYAWSWDAVYNETYKRINNYIEKGVDGISTSNPTLIKSIIDYKLDR